MKTSVPRPRTSRSPMLVARVVLTVLLLTAGSPLLTSSALASGTMLGRASSRTSAVRHLVREARLLYAGWAMEAYPGDSVAFLMSEMRRQRAAGGNVVWLGHNNPGQVDALKSEPGLSYAVWAASRDVSDPHHAGALAMLQAQRNALIAAAALGIRVVFPIGYQTQMGQAWNAAHPGDLRTAPDGTVYGDRDPIGTAASWLAPHYRHDIAAYYRWVDAAFVQPYSGTLMMLNLADEPAFDDYSPWADATFRAAHGYGLHEAGLSVARRTAVGHFEATYIADYAAWSATLWQSVDAAVSVTMSFDGGWGRYQHEGPDLETIFAHAPANFVVTFDAYPRDGLYNTALREQDLIALVGLVRTLGYYSAVYHRPLWLWSTANSWGLNGASPDPGNVADAVANGVYLAQLARSTGGDLQGIAAWNYNIRGQGLYHDTHHLGYDPDAMFARVSASFTLIRSIMATAPGSPDTAVLAPNAPALAAAGARLARRADDLYNWAALAASARADVRAVELTHLTGLPLPHLHTVLVLARSLDDVSRGDRALLRTLLAAGGTVVASGAIAAALAGSAPDAWLVASNSTATIAVHRLRTKGGSGLLVAVDGTGVEDIFSDASAGWAGPVWQLVLRRVPVTAGYLVTGGSATLVYTIAQGGAAVDLPAPNAPSILTAYDIHGAVLSTQSVLSRSGPLHIVLARRSYALLSASSG